jgi:phosphopantothenoylcysteine decarboxylase/phosphopantothenate--cysteine ligase
VVNDVSHGQVFGRSDNEVTLLDRAGGATTVPPGPKEDVADAVWDAVRALLQSAEPVTTSAPSSVE